MPGNMNKGISARFMNGAIPPAALLAAVRSGRPLIHHITNSVTINDCANITICTGAAR